MADLDNIAGFAALINSLILWPMLRDLKQAIRGMNTIIDNHEGRIKKQEERKCGCGH